jgi:hypothetical protein
MFLNQKGGHWSDGLVKKIAQNVAQPNFVKIYAHLLPWKK